jgi:monothiol glutaredoxin
VDHVPGPDGGGFRLKDTLQPEPVGQLSPRQARELLDRGELTLVDVRTDAERLLCLVPGSLHLDSDGEARLDALDRATPLGFLCHHGIRSAAAAERYTRKGFRQGYNVQGGIDAWAVTVDPALRRY